MSDVKDDFQGVVPDYTPIPVNPVGSVPMSVPTSNQSGGLVPPPAFA